MASQSRWNLNVYSTTSSESWHGYAQRWSRLLAAFVTRLPGFQGWFEVTGATWQQGERVDHTDLRYLERCIQQGQLRDDDGKLMPGAPSTGAYMTRFGDVADPFDVFSSWAFGGDETQPFPASAMTRVLDSEVTLRTRSEEWAIDLLGAVVAAFDAQEGIIRPWRWQRPLSKAGVPRWIGSHTFLRAPIDPAHLPDGLHQHSCATGYVVVCAASDPQQAIPPLLQLSEVLKQRS